jgi:integrase
MLRVNGQLRTHRLPPGITKTDAVKELRRLKSERDAGQVAIPRSVRMTVVGDAAFTAMDAKVASGAMSARTVALYRQRWHSHLKARIGKRKLSEITKPTVLRLSADLRKDGLSDATAAGVLVVLRSVLKFARNSDLGSVNPFADIDRAALPSAARASRDMRVLREHEIWRLLDATLPGYRPIVTLLAWSGLRVSEALGLRWQDISFVDDEFTVNGQLAPAKPGNAPEIVKTKSMRGIRTVPFLPVVRETLIDHLANEQDAGRGRDEDFLFVTRTGRPLTRQNVSERGIEQAGRRAGLGVGIRAHTLRRSFCTFVAEGGTPPAEAASLTGHDEAVWWKHYVQPRRDEQARREIVTRLTDRGVGVRPQVDQEVDQPG